jgi:acylphosphatase
MTVTRQLRLYGRVQGVFFRESLSQKARELGLSGWVRNRMDGSLEAMLQGDEAAVSTAIEWASRGPERARVDKLEVSEGSGDYADFQRLPSS